MKAVAFTLILLAGCAPVEESAPVEASQDRLASTLSGLERGEPQRCIDSRSRYDLDILGRDTVLFRQGRDRIYRVDFPGGCGALGPSAALAYRTVEPGRICRGDIVRVLDTATGSVVGGCAFPQFIPYSRPGSGVDPIASR